MQKLSLLPIIISIFAFIFLLTGVFGLPADDTVKWIYDYGLSGLVLTDLNITRSDSEIVVTGTIENKDPDFTKLTAYMKLHLYGNSSELLNTLVVDPKQILKPDQKVDFVARYANPKIASKLEHIYAQFYADNCGVSIVNNMGCFGQTVNVTQIDPRTKLPIK